MFVLHAFVLVKWKERSCGLPVHHKKRTHSYTRVGECVLFLVTACEEIIAKDKTGNNNQDGKLMIELHIIVAYEVSILAVAQNLVDNVKYKVEEYTGMEVGKITVCVEGVRVIN